MFDRLSQLVLKSPKKVVLLTLLVVLLAGAAGGSLQKRLTLGGYEATGSQSGKAASILDKTFKQGEPNLVMIVSNKQGVDDPTAAQSGEALTARISKEADVTNVTSYWSAGKPAALRSKSGNEAMLLGRITGNFDHVIDRVKKIDKQYSGTFEGLQVKTGGSAMMWNENTAQSTKDATKADGTVFPLVLIILVIIFGSAVAALLPLSVAIAAMLMSMGVLFGITFFADTSSVVVNSTTFLGLGLGIDYSLLFVTRYREELKARNGDFDGAITATLHTAGRTVMFSALTVAVCFLGVLALPYTVLRSLAVGCMTTALLAAAVTLVMAPALLKWIGPRIDKWRLIRRKDTSINDSGGFWHSLATKVMRRPVLISVLVLAFMVVLALPAFSMKLRLPDESVLPAHAKSATVARILNSDFDTREQQALQIVAPDSGNPQAKKAQIAAYAQQVSKLPDVTRVDALTGSYSHGAQVAPPTAASARFATQSATYLSAIPSVDPYSTAGTHLVNSIRHAQTPLGDIKVGGPAAVSTDTFHILKQRLPIAGIVLFIGMFILLFLLTGSVLLPIKAMVLTALSLTATFGALVFIFQEGHLKGMVGDFNVTGGITWTVPVMLFAITFALSMDYEVFMLSRIKEEYDRSDDNEYAVAMGLERVGKIVTYAALLLSIVFLVLVTSGISYMKALGLGLALAIVMDATLIRGLLLPAFMKLMGRANWWAPGPMRKLHTRFGISELEEAPSTPAAETASTISS